MNHLEELKEFARLHARSQGMDPQHTDRLLGRITNDTAGDPASWAAVWTDAGRAAADDGELLSACSHFALARFPHHGDPARQEAQRLGVRTFDTWRRGQRDIERLELKHPDGDVMCWASGLDAARPKPLLVVMGGIVSVKEQWARLLPLLRRLGFAAVVTEFPGVGENTTAYRPDSWRLLTFLMDQLAGRADTADTSMLTLSFSGHLALRAAADDPRIRRVLTVGAPVAEFFTDEAWWPKVPGITADTLVRLTESDGRDELRERLPDFALTAGQLRAVAVPVRYVASSRDEIIPEADHRLLLRTAPDVRIKTFDDVHGSPAHLAPMRRWLIGSLLRARLTRRRTSSRPRPANQSRRQS
ncbi:MULTISPECIES: alpha/beta hydrolase [unclassified Streptomyces]|uniref:alpha/beta hydrolase n=1 Tax=unclassified Streptomyces TaxID=2593676 RepID=UPI002257FE74|nr:MULTISPECIES: alpha/beta hydrolase [unclassified Streptomyces]MCX5141931.1 esterase FrsA [Streptomyces sp. NBC_00338]WRZ66405.1 esterase FrsA [Streptomyces sp. NBC_01257]WSU60399.1 esterase FrsA [Streptomyces sp. NBC_01104]